MRENNKESLTQKVVLAGKYGFWYKDLKNLFEKENWDFFLLDKSYPEPRELFRIQNINVLLYAVDFRQDLINGTDSNKKLLDFLRLAQENHVERVYLLSTVEAIPVGDKIVNQMAHIAENILQDWSSSAGIAATVIRLPEIYGLGADSCDGWVARWMNALYDGAVTYDIPAGEGKRCFLYVDDAVYGIYKAVAKGTTSKEINLVADNGVNGNAFKLYFREALQELPQLLQDSTKAPGYDYPVLDAAAAKKELDWQEKYPLKIGLKLYWSKLKLKKSEVTADSNDDNKWQRLKKTIVPYLENIAGFLLMTAIMYFQGNSPVNSLFYFDMNFIYIGAMGLLYGKTQSIFAMVLSSLLLIYSLLINGSELIAIFYVPVNLLHLTAYLFTAIITGYFADSRVHEREAANWHLEQAQNRYNFLRKLYDTNIEIKERLYKQIVNSDDSIGRIYRIVRQLDSVEIENVFTQAAKVTAQILDAANIAVYVTSKDGWYLRQKVRIGKLTLNQPRSLRVADNTWLKILLTDKMIFVNRDFISNVPDMAVPIVYEDKVIAVIAVMGLKFEQWSVYQQNLLSVTARLIASSMGRAYQYEAEIQARRYLDETRILNENEFRKVIAEIRKRHNLDSNYSSALLRLVPGKLSLAEIDAGLASVIRNEDFIGIINGDVYIVLTDSDENITYMVQQRLKQAGFATEVSEGHL